MDRQGRRRFIIISFTILSSVLCETTLIQSRIVGGSKINITDVPFVLSLRLHGEHICGAAVISQDWGLTAAHCVTTFVAKTSAYSVRSGSSLKDEGGEIHNISSIIWHDRYNDTNDDYDIAVFKVDPPFHWDETTKPVDLPRNDGYINDEWGIIAGWGYYRLPGNVLSQDLRYAILPKIDRNTCVSEYATISDVTPHQVCYGYEQGGIDSCKGDSGGPLFTTTKNKKSKKKSSSGSSFGAKYEKNKKVLIGIVSWGEECAGERSPGVYTTIFLMTDWIAEKTGVRSRL